MKFWRPDSRHRPRRPMAEVALELAARADERSSKDPRSHVDSIVQVHVAAPEQTWPNFTVFDASGRLLGWTEAVTAPSSNREFIKRLIEFRHPDGAVRLVVNVTTRSRLLFAFEVTGSVDAEIIVQGPGANRIDIRASNEPYGALMAREGATTLSAEATLVDHCGNPIGLMRSVAPVGAARIGFVLSADPSISQPLRALLPLLPLVVTVAEPTAEL